MSNKMDVIVKKNRLLEISSLYHSTRVYTSASELRRKMLQVPEIMSTLDNPSRLLFQATTRKLIGEYESQELVDRTAQMFKFIALDVGYKIPGDTMEWTYICTRLLDVLKKYYATLSLAEVKLAFELAAVGELNAFLPRDSSGNADKNHYQQFSVEYFTKILNAYQRKRESVLVAAYRFLKEPPKQLEQAQIEIYKTKMAQQYKDIYLEHKYTGKYEFKMCEEILIYDWLRSYGLADEIVETEQDRKEALGRFLNRAARGWVNKYLAAHVRDRGVKSSELDYTAYEIARRKEIFKTFKRMQVEEVDINNYLS